MDALKTAELWLARAMIFVVPVIIWRVALDPFDLMKGTTLWVLGSTLLGIRMFRIGLERRFGIERLLAFPLLGLCGAAIATTIFSISPWTSLFGQYQRYTGLLTILSLSILAAVISEQARESVSKIVWLLVGAGVIVVLYGYLQEYGRDPFEWTSSSFGKFVFSTMGNPNTASAWLSVFTPLLLAISLNQVSKSSWRFSTLAVFSASAMALLPAFYSFQGQVAVVISIPVCALIARGVRVGPVGSTAAIFIGLTSAVAAQFDYSTKLFFAVLLLSLCGFLVFRIDFRRSYESNRSGRWSSKAARIAAGLVGALLVVVLLGFGRNRLTSGLSGGFLERGDFYRAGWDVFLNRPILGNGLETFGFTYTRFRPESHAVNLESSRTSSVHSVFLGMFSNGGLVLGVAYLGLIVCVALACFRLLKRSGWRDPIDVGLVGSWLAFQVISLVSVEHVALYTLHFTLIGMIFSRLDDDPRRGRIRASKSRNSKRRRRRTVTPAMWMSSVLAVGGVLFLWTQVTRPVRAAMSSYSGLQAYYSTGDLSFAEEKLQGAATRAPWESIYWLQLAEIKTESGDLPGAAPYALRAAEKSRFQGPIVVSAVAIVFDSGNTEGSLEIMRKAVANDPFAPSLRDKMAILAVLSAERYRSAGDIETARSLLQEALQNDPDIQAEGLDELKAAVGL